MTVTLPPWLAWLAAALAILGANTLASLTIAAALKRRTGGCPAPGAGKTPVPGQRAAGAAASPGRPAPAPGFTPAETAALGDIYASRIAVPPRGAYAAQVIADGLRERFPGLTDAELGLVALDLYGYARALACGLPDPRAALRAIVDSFGLAAEDLTRLARTEEVHFDQH